MRTWARLSASIVAASLLSCGSDIGDRGAAVFTTWGEEYIEAQLPPDPTGESGFVDGWTVKYEKFLVAFHEITVADRKGEIAARMIGTRFVDNVRPGRKTLVTFNDVPAQSWDAVSYVIRPGFPDAEVVAGDPADRDMMAREGYSLFVQGTGSKDGMVKKFRWGFKTITHYTNCQQAAASGPAVAGIVVTNRGTDTSELTTHGDHLFYDRLASSPNPAVPTRLRFDAIAAADVNSDGEVTLDELTVTPIDVRTYDPSGQPAVNMGEFVTALARTVGHFRGEGECSVTALR
ncbi:MAG: hypothetical protein ABW252_19275 [Polyangiales bacterium]